MTARIAPEQMATFTAFEEKLRPMMRRFDHLSQDQRCAFLQSVLGAYIQEAERANGGDLQAASVRCLKMTETQLNRIENGGMQTIDVYVQI